MTTRNATIASLVLAAGGGIALVLSPGGTVPAGQHPALAIFTAPDVASAPAVQAAATAFNAQVDRLTGYPQAGVPATPAPACATEGREPTTAEMAAMQVEGAPGYGWSWHRNLPTAHPSGLAWAVDIAGTNIDPPDGATAADALGPDWYPARPTGH